MRRGWSSVSRALGDGLEATSVQHEPQRPEAGRAAIWSPSCSSWQWRAVGAGWGSGQSIRWGYSWRHPSLAAEMFGIGGWGRTEATWGPEWAEVGLVESQLLRQ